MRLAARYEEDTIGSTTIGYRSAAYSDSTLGSGMSFPDDVTYAREAAVNASRIEAWRRTESYKLYQSVRVAMT